MSSGTRTSSRSTPNMISLVLLLCSKAAENQAILRLLPYFINQEKSFDSFNMKLLFNTYLLITIISIILVQVTTGGLEPQNPHRSYLKSISLKVCKDKADRQFKTLQAKTGRLILSEEIMRKFLQKTFNENFGSALKDNFYVILYILLVALILVTLFFLWYFFLKKGISSLIYLDKKKKFRNRILLGIILITLLILLSAICGLIKTQQINSAVKDSICIYLTGNQGISKSPILKTQGSNKNFFNQDIQNFQIKLAKVQEQGFKIIKSQQIQKIVALSQQLSQNQYITRLSIDQNAKKLLQNIYQLTNLTKQAYIFISFFRQKLKVNREKLIKFIQNIDLIFSIQNFPFFVAAWPNLLFFVIIIQSIATLALFIKLLSGKTSLNKRICSNLLFFQGLIILLLILTLILLFIAENVVQANCFILHDTHSKKLFQQYYKNYNEREEPLLRQYVRKREGHQSGGFNLFYDKFFPQINKNIINHYQTIRKFSRVKQINFEQKGSLVNQKKIINHQTELINQISYFDSNNIEFFSSLPIFFQSRNPATNSSILDYNIEQIGLYQRRFLYQTCHTDLNLIISLDNAIFVVILLKLTLLIIISRQENASLKKLIRIQSQFKLQENQNTLFTSNF